MFPRLLIPTMLAVSLTALLMGCAPAVDNQQSAEKPTAPQAQKTDSKPQELMAVGGELVFYQANVRYLA